MSETKHTPGPWVVHVGQHGPISIDTVRPKGETVVSVVYFRPTYRPSLADCNLMAAAPKMLEALKDIAARCEREAAQFDPLSARSLFASNIAAFARTQIKNVEGRHG